MNKACEKLENRLKEYKNENIASYLQSLKLSNNNEHCLWSATKYLKCPAQRSVPIKNRDNTWCRSNKTKVMAFASFLTKTFSQHDLNGTSNEEEILNFLNIPCPMDLPIKPVRFSEVKNGTKKINNKKDPGYDAIDATPVKLLTKNV